MSLSMQGRKSLNLGARPGLGRLQCLIQYNTELYSDITLIRLNIMCMIHTHTPTYPYMTRRSHAQKDSPSRFHALHALHILITSSLNSHNKPGVTVGGPVDCRWREECCGRKRSVSMAYCLAIMRSRYYGYYLKHRHCSG